MKKSRNLKSNSGADTYSDDGFKVCVRDLLENELVQTMSRFPQHCNYSCYDHCLYVSYTSYKVCKMLKLDYTSAARGALLHDMFLYDWRVTQLSDKKHAFSHASIALENSDKEFSLNKKEKDIITKHMWPVNIALPRYKESYVVCLVDKWCAFREIQKYYLGFF